MPPGPADPARDGAERRAQRLLVVWQHPETRRFVQVAHLDVRADGQYVFAYEPGAEQVAGFEGFAAFPDLDRRYRSDRLFPFFANRVLSPRRPEYASYLDALDIADDEQAPVELLARSGGARATDTVHIVPEPRIDPDGREVLCFLVSGTRHLTMASEAIAQLSAGNELALQEQPDNPVNRDALMLVTAAGVPVGWVPDYLLDLVGWYRARGTVRVLVERPNGPEVPPHLRLLCRLEATLSHAHR